MSKAKETKIIYNKIKEIDNKINELQREKSELNKKYIIESYNNRKYLIGKCYQWKNHFYKIIDLDITNEYRCIVLSFVRGELNLSEMEYKYNDLYNNNNTIMHTITNLGEKGIDVNSLMIKDLRIMKEIEQELFNEQYFLQCKENLNADIFLLQERQKAILKDQKKNL